MDLKTAKSKNRTSAGKKLRMEAYLEQLSDEQLAELARSARICDELDRCFTQCHDQACEFHDFVLLVRTPETKDLRAEMLKWLRQIDDEHLGLLLAAPLQCSTQSFCISYCGARCAFAELYAALGQNGHLGYQQRLDLPV